MLLEQIKEYEMSVLVSIRTCKSGSFTAALISKKRRIETVFDSMGRIDPAGLCNVYKNDLARALASCTLQQSVACRSERGRGGAFRRKGHF